MPKQLLESSVFNAALARIEYAYNNFDLVLVGFSGGKDSYLLAHLAKLVAFANDKLPVNLVFSDGEIVDPLTEEFILKQTNDLLFNFYWFCFQGIGENYASIQHRYYTTWDESKKNKWMRNIPSIALTENDFPEWEEIKKSKKKGVVASYFKKFNKSVIILRGLRAEESLLRYRAINNVREQNWICKNPEQNYLYLANPIYDWTIDDVWLAYRYCKLDYNPIYDALALYGIPARKQRVDSVISQYGIKDLPIYQKLFPEWWGKLCHRIEGVEAATRYVETFLYSVGKYTEKPPHMSWKDLCYQTLNLHPEPYRSKVKDVIEQIEKEHKAISGDNVPDAVRHSKTSVCWKALTKIAFSGDIKQNIRGVFTLGKRDKSAYIN